MADLSSIMEHLKVLNLNVSRVPSLKEYKAAYRELMRLHPDLGGDTARFQEITLAAREVFEYIRLHQSDPQRPDKGSDQDFLKAFESSTTVNYNTGNIVFEIKAAEAATWVDCLTNRLGKPLPLETGGSLQFKMEDFKIPRMSTTTRTNYGSVTITIWPHPKTTSPKIMVQGKCHLAFFTFIVPSILKEIKAAKKLTITGKAKPPEILDSSDEESENKDSQSVSMALVRLEKEVLNLRNDMAERIEVALGQRQGGSVSDSTTLDQKFESLENLLRVNNEQHVKLVSSIDQLKITIENSSNTGMVHLDSKQLDRLVTDVTNSQVSQATNLNNSVTAIMSEMAQAATLTTVQGKVESLTTVLDQVQTTVLKIDKNVNEVKRDVTKASEIKDQEMVQLRKNSDDSLKMFGTMIETLKNIEAKASSKTFPTTPTDPTTNLPKPADVLTRRGIMFTSSVAIDTDIKRYKEELNCELKIIPTENVEEDTSATDPDSYLGSMVNKHLRHSSGYNFAIFATGTSDITNLDIENSPATTLFSRVSSQSKTVFDIAESITKEVDIDVFIVDKPPRYDSEDDAGMKQKLTKYSNGVIASSTGATPRIFLVEQTSLGRTAAKARADIFQKDGVNLTPKGLSFYNTNIINVMKECYPDAVAHLGHNSSPQQGQGQDPGVEHRGTRGQGPRGQGPRGQVRDRGQDQHQYQRGGQGWGGRSGRYNQYRGGQWHQPPGWTGQRGGGWGRDSDWGYPHRDFGGYPRGRF